MDLRRRLVISLAPKSQRESKSQGRRRTANLAQDWAHQLRRIESNWAGVLEMLATFLAFEIGGDAWGADSRV